MDLERRDAQREQRDGAQEQRLTARRRENETQAMRSERAWPGRRNQVREIFATRIVWILIVHVIRRPTDARVARKAFADPLADTRP